MVDPRTPVLVGVGTASGDMEAIELMAAAATAAAADAGAPQLLGALQWVAVPRGTWSYTDPGRLLAGTVGAGDVVSVVADVGIPQQTLVNRCLAAIVAGEVDVVLVVGAEARARAVRAAKAGTVAAEVDQSGASPDVRLSPSGELVARAQVDAGLVMPVVQYALIESALRAASGDSIAAHRAQIGELWARFSAVAQQNPEAAFPAAMGAADLSEFGAHNRPLAFPYGKWHASQWTVDQGAALLFCAAEAAERLGAARDSWVFPLAALDSSFSLSLTRRARMDAWPAMGVLGRAAAERLGHPLAACEHVELYSCFPAAVRVQQRELGFPPDGTPTVTGGMAFAGGPLNSFVLHATAAVARRVRDRGGLGLVTTVSGFLTKPGLAVWSGAPDGRPAVIADLAAEAGAATAVVDIVEGYHGPATVAACTVIYESAAPETLVAILDAPDGRRLIARSTAPDLVDEARRAEIIGERFTVAGGRDATISR